MIQRLFFCRLAASFNKAIKFAPDGRRTLAPFMAAFVTSKD
jgi:hypothetical protein